MIDHLKEDVCKANLELVSKGLVKLTWGNASAVDRQAGVMIIKPSGIDYDLMSANDMVVVDLETGLHKGSLKPSSDTPTHLFLYREFAELGGIVHTHSSWATSWAQACRAIPCQGTTHADHFYGSVPVTRVLTESEIVADYELNTGKVIAATFAQLNVLALPAVLVAEHGPFTWGKTVNDAVKHAIILEEIAKMAYRTHSLGYTQAVQDALKEKHYSRKHGPDAYYGQKSN